MKGEGEVQIHVKMNRDKHHDLQMGWSVPWGLDPIMQMVLPDELEEHAMKLQSHSPHLIFLSHCCFLHYNTLPFIENFICLFLIS